MDREKSNLTKDEVLSLKSRWNEKDPDGGEIVLYQMIQRLKTECKKDNLKRPLYLDLRGITLFMKIFQILIYQGMIFLMLILTSPIWQEHP